MLFLIHVVLKALSYDGGDYGIVLRKYGCKTITYLAPDISVLSSCMFRYSNEQEKRLKGEKRWQKQLPIFSEATGKPVYVPYDYKHAIKIYLNCIIGIKMCQVSSTSYIKPFDHEVI